MHYILTHISRREISFYQYIGRTDRVFKPYSEGGSHKFPLAIAYDHHEMHIGQYAVQLMSNPACKAFDNLFDHFNNHEFCQDIMGRDFVPTVVKQGVARVCRSCGIDDTDIKDMRLIVVFNVDVNDETIKNHICDQLRSYCPELVVCEMDRHSASYFCQRGGKMQNAKYALLINSDNIDLSYRCISLDAGQVLSKNLYKDKGQDPRVKMALDLLWEDVYQSNYNLDKTNETPYLEAALNKFVTSGKAELTSVELSDGTYDVYLSKSKFESFSSNDASAIPSVMSQGLYSYDPNYTCVVLEGCASKNAFFRNSLKNYLDVYDEDKDVKLQIFNSILVNLLNGADPNKLVFKVNPELPQEPVLGAGEGVGEGEEDPWYIPDVVEQRAAGNNSGETKIEEKV